MVHHIPFDIWLHISLHCSVQSLMSLRGTCKYVHSIMEERSVWDAAFRDILEVIPLRGIRCALPDMSSTELQRKASRLCLVDNLWSRDTIHPVKIERHSLGPDICRVEVLPGGEFVLTLCKDGELQLRNTRDFTEPLTTVTRPNQSSYQYYPESTDMRRSVSERGENWAVVLDYYSTYEGEPRTDLRIYLIDTTTSSMRLLSTMTKHGYCIDYHPMGGFLATSIQDGGNYLVSLRKICFSSSLDEKEVVLNLGQGMNNPRTTILCAHKFLVSTALSLRLYQIPEMGPICNDGAFRSNIAAPIAIHAEETPGETPRRDKLIWDALCDHHDGRFAIYTWSTQEELLVQILPAPGQSQDSIVCYSIDGPCAGGTSRIIGCKEFVDMQPMELRCYAHFMRPDMCVGYMRLGRSKAFDPSHSVLIPLLGHDGRAEDLHWDEESGRLCVLFSPKGDRDAKALLIIDMI